MNLTKRCCKLALAPIILLYGCTEDYYYKRIPSSTGKLVATIADNIGGGAATSEEMEIYISPSSRNYNKDWDLVFSGQSMNGVKLNWISDKLLLISYKSGFTKRYVNPWGDQAVLLQQKPVKYNIVVVVCQEDLCPPLRRVSGQSFSGQS